MPHAPSSESPTNYRRAETPEEWYPLLILETIRLLKPESNRILTGILLGDKEPKWMYQCYQQYRFYGKLDGHLTRQAMIELIERMLAAGFRTWQDVIYGRVVETAKGAEALKSRAALPELWVAASASSPLTPLPCDEPPPQVDTRCSHGVCPPSDCVTCRGEVSKALFGDWEVD